MRERERLKADIPQQKITRVASETFHLHKTILLFGNRRVRTPEMKATEV